MPAVDRDFGLNFRLTAGGKRRGLEAVSRIDKQPARQSDGTTAGTRFVAMPMCLHFAIDLGVDSADRHPMKHIFPMTIFALLAITACALAVAAEASSSTSQAKAGEKVVGSCVLSPKDVEGGFLPQDVAKIYFRDYEHKEIADVPIQQIRISKPPKHGTLKFVMFSEYSGDPHFIYKPAKGFLGKDSAEFSVAVGNETLRVIESIVVYRGVSTGSRELELCPRGSVWKISRGLDFHIAHQSPRHAGKTLSLSHARLSNQDHS